MGASFDPHDGPLRESAVRRVRDDGVKRRGFDDGHRGRDRVGAQGLRGEGYGFARRDSSILCAGPREDPIIFPRCPSVGIRFSFGTSRESSTNASWEHDSAQSGLTVTPVMRRCSFESTHWSGGYTRTGARSGFDPRSHPTRQTIRSRRESARFEPRTTSVFSSSSSVPSGPGPRRTSSSWSSWGTNSTRW